MGWEIYKRVPDRFLHSTPYLRRLHEAKNNALPSLEEDTMREKCAVFGIYTKKDAASYVYLGLSALQHRGQEASGICASSDSLLFHKGEGLVSQVYRRGDIDRLKGHIAIGHNRYATSGGEKHLQPVVSEKKLVALAHNGTLPQTEKLEAFLHKNNIPTKGLNDSEMMQRALEHYVTQGMSLEDAVKNVYPLFTGAFALVVMTKDKVIGLRDSHGIRPLSIGKLGHEGYAFSSETVGLDSIGAAHKRDVSPGEMVVVDENGLHSHQLVPEEKTEEKLDIFELIYFASPQSILYGKKVNDMRVALGEKLAEETKQLWEKTDIVFGVPNSAVPAATGYMEKSGIRYDPDALHKNSYIHRTFIDPAKGGREQLVKRKFSTMRSRLEGKRVTVVDDSIVRGPTLRVLVKMLKDAGACAVNVVVSSPPVKYPDFYGIDTPTQKELIASHKTVEEIRQYIGADTLHYLSYSGMLEALGIPEEKLCTSCFTGKYPIDIGDHTRHITFGV